jgi:glycerol-3-phosphate dehydrogenase
MAPRVADLMASELGRDAAWKSHQLAAFAEMAKGYLLPG